MINVIWLGFIAIGIIVALVTGNAQVITDAALASADTAVELSIGLIGVMALWLGLMKIAEEAGMVRALGNALRPIMKFLFPEVPDDHPAMGAIVMNMAANIFGLGNAATPLGIKAMKELQKLNDEKDTATNPMCTFLAINTSSLTLIASSVVAYRAAAGSTNATEIIGATIIATIASTIAAIIAVKLLQKLPIFNKTEKEAVQKN
ncbi:nucleoside recognition domain-containing protein [Marinisporobacter balticus]|uniref:Spore maturation protein A n=1 Tax=Marinisporobacter balticus TaxID=2018667 RepID=A0A4R2KFD5_9FIRM|nr:nucleoside recognition domain-containing protein [Marinisporobacter balticus]TCO71052.1 spore maturation protein A [Marinisporobacter balticus]